MAKTQAEPPGRSGSQFFVVTVPDAGLTPDYALVGKVSSGFDVVQRIMGHEDVTTTLGIYTDVPADFVQRVEDMLVVDPLWIESVDEPENEEDPSGEGP